MITPEKAYEKTRRKWRGIVNDLRAGKWPRTDPCTMCGLCELTEAISGSKAGVDVCYRYCPVNPAFALPEYIGCGAILAEFLDSYALADNPEDCLESARAVLETLKQHRARLIEAGYDLLERGGKQCPEKKK